MATQPILVLTRPYASAQRLKAQINDGLAVPCGVIISPALEIVPNKSLHNLSQFDGVIVTSKHAVQGKLNGIRTFCVGETTAQAAVKAGGQLIHCAPDVDALLVWLKKQPDLGRLIYLRGSHVTLDIRANLALCGIACEQYQAYRQNVIPLTPDAIAAIEGEQSAILPLFSPRSARLVGQVVTRLGQGLCVIAISPAVAQAWCETTGGICAVATRPTGSSMVEKIMTALHN